MLKTSASRKVTLEGFSQSQSFRGRQIVTTVPTLNVIVKHSKPLKQRASKAIKM